MGCNNEKSLEYLDSPYDEEVQIRQFEEDFLRCFNKTFPSLIRQMASQKEIIPKDKAELFFKKEYSETMLKLVNHPYFISEQGGDEYYDAQKIKNLIYATCPDMPMKINGNTIHDKIGFVYTIVKSNPDEALSTPLNKEDKDLKILISDLFDIASEVVVDIFCQVKGVIGDVKQLKECKEKAVNNYIDKFFKVNDKDSNTLTYKEIEEQFRLNPYLFTTGDIRDSAWRLLKLK